MKIHRIKDEYLKSFHTNEITVRDIPHNMRFMSHDLFIVRPNDNPIEIISLSHRHLEKKDFFETVAVLCLRLRTLDDIEVDSKPLIGVNIYKVMTSP